MSLFLRMSEDYQEARPDYLVLGHVTKDILGDGQGSAPGGTATYSSLVAQRLGLQAAVVTACAPEDEWLLDVVKDAGVWVRTVPSEHTTTFRNLYDASGHRTQVISDRATGLRYEDVPLAWRAAPIAHLGPVAQELPVSISGCFPGSLLGITPQGWMRSWDGEGQVTHSASPVPEALLRLPGNAFLILSIEDLGYDPKLISVYANLAPLTAITQGPGEAYIRDNGQHLTALACPARSVDPTGAGDVFATSLLTRYKETGDLLTSARFAHAAAACAIEGAGVSSIPSREDVEERMEECA